MTVQNLPLLPELGRTTTALRNLAALMQEARAAGFAVAPGSALDRQLRAEVQQAVLVVANNQVQVTQEQILRDNYAWGEVIAVATIGDIQIVMAYHYREKDPQRGPDRSEVFYEPYVQGDHCGQYSTSPDMALAVALAYKYERAKRTQAAEYFARMIGMPLEQEGTGAS